MSDIMVKIKKLKNMEESARAIGNNEEAAAFAGKVQTLLLEHKLEIADIESIELDSMPEIEVDEVNFNWEGTGIGQSGKRSMWLSHLTHYVCEFNGCKNTVTVGSNRVSIIGTADSRAVVIYLLTILARFGRDSMEAAYRREYYQAKKEGDTYRMKGFRRSFMTAYVSIIHKRLKEYHEAAMSKGVTERGLMVLDQEKLAVEDFMSSMKLGKASGFQRGQYNREGIMAGIEAGEKAQLAANALRHQESASKIA